MKPKDIHRLKEETAEILNKWKEKRAKEGSTTTAPPLQPFVWAALPLFGDNLKLPDDVIEKGMLKFDNLYAVQKHGPFDDASLFEAIPDITDKKELPKAKVFITSLSLSLSLSRAPVIERTEQTVERL